MMNWGRHIQNSNTFDTDMEVITVRNARKEDASDVAWLIMMAWPVEEFLAMDESLTEESLHERIQSYVEADDTTDIPCASNGSPDGVAGIASTDGRHLAMMPHLERAIFPWQCGYYPENRRSADEVTPWIEAFVNARRWIEQHKK